MSTTTVPFWIGTGGWCSTTLKLQRSRRPRNFWYYISCRGRLPSSCVSVEGGVGAISETCLLMAILWEGEVLAPLVQQKYVSIFVITVLLSISVLKLSGNSRINIRFTQHRISLGNRLKAIKIIIKTLKTCRLCYSPPMQIHFGEEDIRLDVM